LSGSTRGGANSLGSLRTDFALSLERRDLSKAPFRIRFVYSFMSHNGASFKVGMRAHSSLSLKGTRLRQKPCTLGHPILGRLAALSNAIFRRLNSGYVEIVFSLVKIENAGV